MDGAYRSSRASVGHVAEHSSANRVPGAGAARLELPGQIEVDLILQDFLDHDRQLVVTRTLTSGRAPLCKAFSRF